MKTPSQKLVALLPPPISCYKKNMDIAYLKKQGRKEDIKDSLFRSIHLLETLEMGDDGLYSVWAINKKKNGRYTDEELIQLNISRFLSFFLGGGGGVFTKEDNNKRLRKKILWLAALCMRSTHIIYFSNLIIPFPHKLLTCRVAAAAEWVNCYCTLTDTYK